MKERAKSVAILLIVLLMSWLIRLFAVNHMVMETVKKLCSVTWNS
jgi:hypothetical protein